MQRLIDATPEISVWVFKSIDRHTIDGQSAVSARYQGRDPYIDLTPFLGDNSSVRTSKSVREPAGGFQITLSDQAQKDWASTYSPPGFQALETVYGLIEPMDIIEIRMWGGDRDNNPYTNLSNYSGFRLPIVMRGFVTEVQRSQAMGQDGRPVRTVTITGQDYGKIWQMLQVLYFPAYSEGKALLTSKAFSELFGSAAVNAISASDFVAKILSDVINPFLAKFMPYSKQRADELGVPYEIMLASDVRHGTVNQSFQDQQGSVYEIMRMHADVPVWNELFIEDQEDGVYCVYRPVPALHLTAPPGKDRMIQEGGVMPFVVPIYDSQIVSLTVSRTDANVANFFWVNNSRFDLIDDQSRKMAAITEDSDKVSLKEYPNTAVKYYGVRPMYTQTQQGGDDVKNHTGGQKESEQTSRSEKQEAWIDKRRRHLMEMNKDNVVFERGTMRVKGGPMGTNGLMLHAGQYIEVHMGPTVWLAYAVQVDHEFVPFQGYTTTIQFDRGEGFALRTSLDSLSPWLVEQAL